MGRGRAAGALIVMLISGALIDIARGGDLVECEPQRVTGDGRWPCYRSGSIRCGGLPSQDVDYGLFVPEMMAE